MSAPAACRIDGVSHRYGRRSVLENIDLTLEAGAITALLGPSGCGKSTLVRLLAGLEPLQTGRIKLPDGQVAEPGREPPPERRGVGLVFQDLALFPHLDAARNIAFGLGHLPSAERQGRVAELLGLVGLVGRGADLPHELSGGMQQRVALARALARRPGLLLLDEPFSGLDPVLRLRLRGELRALVRRLGVACLVVTHDPDEALHLGDRLAVIDRGRIVQDGSPSDCLDRPAAAFVAGFLADSNQVTARIADGCLLLGRQHLPLPALPELPPDGSVTAVLRVDGWVLAPTDASDPTAVFVSDERRLGHGWLLDLDLGDGVHIFIRHPCALGPTPSSGRHLRIGLPPGGCFLFPG
jgi:iron(III) transport system ATP-binding protein